MIEGKCADLIARIIYALYSDNDGILLYASHFFAHSSSMTVMIRLLLHIYFIDQYAVKFHDRWNFRWLKLQRNCWNLLNLACNFKNSWNTHEISRIREVSAISETWFINVGVPWDLDAWNFSVWNFKFWNFPPLVSSLVNPSVSQVTFFTFPNFHLCVIVWQLDILYVHNQQIISRNVIYLQMRVGTSLHSNK